MDTARCICAGPGKAACPIHGPCSATPLVPYALTQTDKTMLRTMRIDPYDHAAIREVRQADEDRFKQ